MRKDNDYFEKEKKKRQLLAQMPLILMFLLLAFVKDLDLRLGFNNHLININYHQKIYSFCFM